MEQKEILQEITWAIGRSPGSPSLVEEHPDLMEEVAKAFRRQWEEEDWNFRREY